MIVGKTLKENVSGINYIGNFYEFKQNLFPKIIFQTIHIMHSGLSDIMVYLGLKRIEALHK